MLKDIGIWLLTLTAILIFGRLWFSLVEWLLPKIKSLFGLNGQQEHWHAFKERTDEEW